MENKEYDYPEDYQARMHERAKGHDALVLPVWELPVEVTDFALMQDAKFEEAEGRGRCIQGSLGAPGQNSS